ncbi:STAS domain-containing protein [Chloroflexales bacterium ZM16-3]|nr:STAS domain-containing protein [Chloroflexales bacterium ZM16-3]
MRLSQRQVVLALLTLLTIGGLFSLLYQMAVPDEQVGTSLISTSAGLLILASLLIAYWRGWSAAPYVTLVLITLLIGLTADGVYLTQQFTLDAFLPPVLALIIADPLWIVGCTLGLLMILIVRAGGQGVYVDPIVLLLYLMPVGGIVLARMVTDTAQRDVEASADQARQSLARVEAQAHEMAQKSEELAAQNQQQRQLLDLVATLETPTVSLADGVLFAPVVGHFDSRRANDLTRRLLNEVSTQRAKMLILDIAGVPMVDTAVSQALLRAIHAVRLLGCEVVITGISASVAATMTQLGIDLSGVRTARTPQEVLGAGTS